MRLLQEHNWDVQRTAEGPPGNYLERIQRGHGPMRQIIRVPEGPDGDCGFYSECRGEPSKNFGWGRMTLLDTYF